MGVFALDSFVDLWIIILPIPFVSGIPLLTWKESELMPGLTAL